MRRVPGLNKRTMPVPSLECQAGDDFQNDTDIPVLRIYKSSCRALADSGPRSRKQRLKRLGSRGTRSQARENKVESGCVHLPDHQGRMLLTGSRIAALGRPSSSGVSSLPPPPPCERPGLKDTLTERGHPETGILLSPPLPQNSSL